MNASRQTTFISTTNVTTINRSHCILFLWAAALCAVAPAAAAQDSIPWPAGNRLTVTVTADSATVRGDTIRLWYAVSNAAGSEQSAQHLAIRTHVAQYRMAGPTRWYASPGMVQDSAAALWAALFGRPDVQPGQTLRGFWFEAAGLPNIVPFRVQGRYELPVYDDSLPWLYQRAPSFWQNSVGGSTVGLDPLPTSPDVGLLLQRLQGLTNAACGQLQWITDAATCERLANALAQAATAASQGNTSGARTQLDSFLNELASQHNSGGTLPVTHDAYALLRPNALYTVGLIPQSTAQTVFLRGSGPLANPPTLTLSTTAPGASDSRYKDSPSTAMTGDNPWKEVGNWSGAPALLSGALTTLSNAHVWLGLKNSDDIGTNFDVRIDVAKNGSVVATGQTLCIQGITRNPSLAKDVPVTVGEFTATAFNGTSDVLAFKVLVRNGTNGAGASCGGHTNSTGIRLYFDAASRPSRFDATF